MFIDVTRPGSPRKLRLAPSAIAYLDTFGDGTAIYLVGGEMLRVVETRAEIEASCAASSPQSAIDPAPEAAAIDMREATGLISPSAAIEERVALITRSTENSTRDAKPAGRGKQSR